MLAARMEEHHEDQREFIQDPHTRKSFNGSGNGSARIKSHPGASHSVILNVLEAARSRAEYGLPPYGDLWENPSAEETRNSIEGLNQRLASYND